MPAQTSKIDMEIFSAAAAPHADLSPLAAKAILKLDFSEKQHVEIQRLLDKNNQGTISTSEKKKLENYVRIGDILMLLKAKARFGKLKKPSRR